MNLRPVIVGGGSAGMAAAIELARRGVPCVLFDEASRPGGVVYRGPLRAGVDPASLGARYTRMLEKLRRDFSACAGHIDLRLNSRVVGGDGQHLMVLDEAERLHEVEYSHLLLATGCHERSVPFPGWTLPGVMLLGGLQLQIKSGVVKPLGDTLIAGSGPLLPLVACQLHAAGVRVAGVYEACAFGRMARESLALLNKPQLFLDGLSMLGYLKLNGIPLHYGWGVVEASGEGELTEVTVAPYDEEWRPDLENARPVKASTLAVGYGFIPRTQLSQQLGLEHGFSDDGYLRAECNVWQQSSQPHIHLAGDMAGIRGGEAAMIGGRIAALSILLQREAIAPAEAIERRESHLARLEAIKRFRAGVERYTQRGARQVELALGIEGVERLAVGTSVQGRDIELLRVRRHPDSHLKLWVIAQQHPGEHMAEWFMEGLIERLQRPDDTEMQRLLEKADLYLVPNMNPDGAFHGNLRTNAAGQDLNRAWLEPSAERSPEVWFVQQEMKRHGVDLFLDIHGDEEIPHVFAAGCEGNPGYTPRLERLEQRFREELMARGEFQIRHGYPRSAPGQANLALACNFVGQTYDCLAFTIEMPFKDHDDNPEPGTGWSGARSKRLGQDVLSTLAVLVDELR
ncbi:FAD-binding protein [Pseudomonas aeruginosa]|uniref:FAD-binding protein n=16 Tax=Bacteria TaxID=2 RepID=A0A367MEL5_PSEAI|nr:FAD-binding protein [Pseudomonas aeruginosa]